MSQHHDIDWTRARELWEAGVTRKIIAHEIGVTRQYLSAVATTNRWKREHRYSEKRIQEVLDLYLGTPGVSARDVGEFLKPQLTKGQVLWIVRRYRWTWNGHGRIRGSTHI